jgi:hypothetical protein
MNPSSNEQKIPTEDTSVLDTEGSSASEYMTMELADEIEFRNHLSSTLKRCQDKYDRLRVELTLLIQKLEMYLERSSLDGKSDRQELRNQLKQNIAEVKPLLGETD